MRHRVYGKHLGRNKDQRKNLFKGLIYSLLSYGSIQTSEAKAKAIKGLVDKVINSAKTKNLSKLQSFVSDQLLQKRLTDEIIPKLETRTSGFTSIVRLGTRLGDQTTMVRMSLIGVEELKPLEKEERIKNKELSKKTKEQETKGVASPKSPIKIKKTQVKRRSKKA